MSLYIDSGTDDYYVLEADLGWIMWGKFPSDRLPLPQWANTGS